MSPKTDRHDIEVKIRSAERFLREGDRVKINVRFRGREIVHSDLVRDRLLEMAKALGRSGRSGAPALYGRAADGHRAYAQKERREGWGRTQEVAPSKRPDEEVMVHAEA